MLYGLVGEKAGRQRQVNNIKTAMFDRATGSPFGNQDSDDAAVHNAHTCRQQMSQAC